MVSNDLSIIICSNRKNIINIQKLKRISDNTAIQIILVTQGYRYSQLPARIKQISFPKNIGVSNARNIGIKYCISKSKIISFTDDDCIISSSWPSEIISYFLKKPDVDLVFGETKPYREKYYKAQNLYCPSVFRKRKETPFITTSITSHWENVGLSNNMAIRSKVFQKLGGFQPWLGPGSIGSNGEDGEFIIRALRNNYKIGYHPKMKVLHNKWLSEEEMIRQSWSYTTGELASYGYYALQGEYKCFPIIIRTILHSLKMLTQFYKCAKGKGNIYRSILFAYNEIVSVLRGLFVAFYFNIRRYFL